MIVTRRFAADDAWSAATLSEKVKWHFCNKNIIVMSWGSNILAAKIGGAGGHI